MKFRRSICRRCLWAQLQTDATDGEMFINQYCSLLDKKLPDGGAGVIDFECPVGEFVSVIDNNHTVYIDPVEVESVRVFPGTKYQLVITTRNGKDYFLDVPESHVDVVLSIITEQIRIAKLARIGFGQGCGDGIDWSEE